MPSARTEQLIVLSVRSYQIVTLLTSPSPEAMAANVSCSALKSAALTPSVVSILTQSGRCVASIMSVSFGRSGLACFELGDPAVDVAPFVGVPGEDGDGAVPFRGATASGLRDLTGF